ncbi:MAG: DUF3048 domain-containing protein [Bacilli bacterium]|nr:DUF3048 domain-containing protein [Bacilli bacterium]
MSKKKRMRKKDKRIIGICISIFILCIMGLVLYFLYFNEEESLIKKKEFKKLKIVDQDSNQRPIAVMIDNNVGYDTHAGLQDSYLNYEIIVEGGYTRIMALFKDRNVDLIGPVRSSRHYFLDYAMESDAIYSHYGWSTYAENDIKTLGINNINGLTAESAYWRDHKIAAPHNVFTNIKTLYRYAVQKGYSTETEDWKLLNYSVDEIYFKTPKVDRETGENEEDPRIVTNALSLKYSNNQTTSYQYDAENKYYLRFMDGKAHLDKSTDQQLHYKNIIIQKVENYSLDSYGRQDLNTVDDGEGYYITNGYALPITWEKMERNKKTVYKYLNGTQVKVNDGNTFIQIIPITTTPEFN